MKKICIIPARGGSKRIPRKNIIMINNKPLIQLNIERLLESKFFDEIVVSSEDAEILEISKSAGASVHLRSLELADDFTSSDDVIKDVIEINKYHKSSIIVCVYAPNVLFPISKLRIAIKNFEKNNKPVITICKFKHPLARALLRGKKDRVNMKYPKFAKVRTQDCEELYFDTGQFYIANPIQWLANYDFLNDDNFSIELKDSEFIDLDTKEDFEDLSKILGAR
jgi:pseudaminic acid cytidylyltransferase